SSRPAWLCLFLDGQGHLGAAVDRVADAVGVLGGDLAVVRDREDVLALVVLVDGENLRDEAGADRVGLALNGVDGDLHSADIRPRGRLLPERLCCETGTESGICGWRECVRACARTALTPLCGRFTLRASPRVTGWNYAFREGGRAPMPVTESSVDFDWFGPEVCRDPQLYDGLIREAAPVVYSPEYDVWATGRHTQIELMMRDWKTFSSTRPAFEEIGQPMILLSDDPPDHQRVRTVISKGMSAAVLRRWQEDFAAEAERLVLSLLDAPDGIIDRHTELAKKYVLKVFPDAIGLGDANREMLIKFGHAQFNMFGPKNAIYRASMDAAVEVFEWVAANCKRDAVKPGGVCMAMYEAADTGAVTQEEAEILVRTLYSAGSDTTIYALGNTLRALAENPDQYQLLRSNIDEFATRAFEEGIRYDNPARFTRRRATTEVEVDGVTLPEDAKLLLLHMPGGRDPRRWENPGTYDITRDVVGKHLGLGFGVHACVGARVARLEGVSLLSALARHVASIELADEPEVTTNMAVHGHEKLPLRIVPA